MYINLSSDVVVKKRDIIGIFDIDNTTVDKATRKFLSTCEKNNQVVNVSYELPKSFVLCSSSKKRKNKNKKSKLYISQFASTTLVKRNLF